MIKFIAIVSPDMWQSHRETYNLLNHVVVMRSGYPMAYDIVHTTRPHPKGAFTHDLTEDQLRKYAVEAGWYK